MKTIGNAGSTARKLEAVASGALPNGQPVIVNADGTVSVVGGWKPDIRELHRPIQQRLP